MCFSPALYCNVTDSWTVADKWKRITISFAGIWVELIIASIATFVWWYTPHWPFVNNVAMCLMVLCSVSTFVFNANPLMRFDGYYILADWLEVPNLRERSNRFLSNLVQEKALGIEVQPEAYMAPNRKVLFVTYAIASFLYRWFVTISILFFLASWLKPYKLEALSMLLAIGALASMVFWPAFRMVKSIRQRGRLPDMKRKRVMVSMGVLAAIVAAFFFLPLPVSRVRDVGMVQVSEGNREAVHIVDTGILTEVVVHDGQYVERGMDLARFTSPQLEFERQQFEKQRDAAAQLIAAIGARRAQTSDPTVRARLDAELQDARAQWQQNNAQLKVKQDQIALTQVVKAPRAGMVMGAPKPDDLLRMWDKADGMPVCTIGDPTKLRILVPVGAVDYREMRINLERKQAETPDDAYLEVDILPFNRSDRQFKGRVYRLPDTDEKNVPVQLTHRGGGSLATKPGGDPNVHQPLVQTYLVAVEVVDPDQTLTPGTLATVKIYLQWKSLAWWTWRSITSALDVGLW
jgi:putative peptide zinc metalloprotease protein